MFASLLLGLVTGLRSLTPLAVVCLAGRGNTLPLRGPFKLLAHRRVATGVTLLAVGELIGDKLPKAPDRIVLPGLAARVVTGALVGAALAPSGRRSAAATVSAAAAVVSAYPSLQARRHAMRRFGQVPAGLAEDAIAVASALCIVAAASRRR